MNIPFDVMIAVASLVYAFGLWTDNIIGKQWSSVIKQGKTWVIGLLAALVLAHVQFTEGRSIAGIPFHDLSTWSQVLLGLTGAAFANTGFHIGQRLDQTGTGDTPDIPTKRARRKLVRNVPTTERHTP